MWRKQRMNWQKGKRRKFWRQTDMPHISHNRHNHGGVLFSSQCTFFHRERDRDCFRQSLFREYKHKYAKQKAWTQSKTPNTPKKTPNTQKNTKYAKKYTKNTKKHQLRQKKHQICKKKTHQILKIFIYAVFSRKKFSSKFTHFLVYFLQA